MDEPWRINGRDAMRDAIVRALEGPAAVSLLVVDLDALLWFNDTFGHDAGDTALWRVWQCLEEIAGGGAGGRVYRTEGGAYSVLLVGGDALEAAIRAEQLRAAVEALRIRNPKPPGGTGWLTVSIGGATRAPGSGMTADELIARAAERRHEAKGRGRNCTITERWSSV